MDGNQSVLWGKLGRFLRFALFSDFHSSGFGYKEDKSSYVKIANGDHDGNPAGSFGGR